MDIDIRKHIISNFKGDNKDVLLENIKESINSKDEVALPGLGVFFELIWNNSDDEFKDKVLDILIDSIKDNS